MNDIIPYSYIVGFYKMDQNEIEALIGKCGFFCKSCPTFANGDCLGCRKAHKRGDCFTFDCVDERRVEYCGLCRDFPCDALFNREKATVLTDSSLLLVSVTRASLIN